jgi:hypothetical protein
LVRVQGFVAVVASGWGKPAVCGCEDLSIDYGAKVGWGYGFLGLRVW